MYVCMYVTEFTSYVDPNYILPLDIWMDLKEWNKYTHSKYIPKIVPLSERSLQNLYSLSFRYDFTPLCSSCPLVLVHAFIQMEPWVSMKS